MIINNGQLLSRVTTKKVLSRVTTKKVLSRVTTKKVVYEVVQCKNQNQINYKALDIIVTHLTKGNQKRITAIYCNNQIMFNQLGLGNAPKELINDLHTLFNYM